MRPEPLGRPGDGKYESAAALLTNSGVSEEDTQRRIAAHQAMQIEAHAKLTALLTTGSPGPDWQLQMLAEFGGGVQEFQKPCDCCKCRAKGPTPDRLEVWCAVAGVLQNDIEHALRLHLRDREPRWTARYLHRLRQVASGIALSCLQRAFDPQWPIQRRGYLVIAHLLSTALLLFLVNARNARYQQGSADIDAKHRQALDLLGKDGG